jgi:CubicO group peptidase (beta-lactamase class C family)/beta-glucosidase-like glycosyl hydrolase
MVNDMNGKKNVFWCCLILMLTTGVANAQTAKQQWIDSVFQTLNENDKIGQLFFVRFSSHADDNFLRDVARKVEDGNLGGIVFTTGTPNKQLKITRRLQAEARIPLLISQDGSSGLGHLLDSALRFPIPLAQGAIPNDSAIFHIARAIGKQLNAMGVHMSLSPNATPVHSGTADANVLFGDDPASVERKALLHMKGLQEAGVLSCAKYFPLKTIEVIDQKGKSELTLYHDTLVSRPYKSLFANGLNAVIPDATDLHLFFEQKRSDLKRKLTDASFALFETGDLLHKPVGFDGIIMIDLRGLQHQEVFSPGDAGLLAFEAGADIIVSDEYPEPALRKIKKLVQSEKAYEKRLDERVRKVLAIKYDAGLMNSVMIDDAIATNELKSAESQVLRASSFRESVTVLRNLDGVLPLKILEDRKFACVIVGDSTERADIFHRTVKKYIQSDRIIVDECIASEDLSKNDVSIVARFPTASKKALQNLMGLLQETSAHQQVIIADFGCKIFEPYATGFPTIITSFDDEKDAVGIMPQVIFGGLPAVGILPTRYAGMKSGSSFKTNDLDRLAYSFPEDAGVDSETLERINRIANEAISSGSTPGCYVLIARRGKVIYDQAFGHLTYDQKSPVTDETIYDLASLTKVSATLQAVMFMQEHGLVDIYKKLSVYLPELRGTNKKDITIIDALTHQAGLAPFVPLWPLTLEGPALKPIYYSSQQNVSYPLQIAPTLFGSPILKDSVWSWITYSKMMEKPKRTPYPYRYSDLGFMMFKQLAERTLNQPMDEFLQQNFYEPLGAYSLGYTPLNRFSADIIAPTELDTLFRGGLLIGTVHDERAAMLGGVSGHAGLFGTANDLSKLGQMLLQEGSYGGLQYYKPETVRLFTAKQFDSSRRGLGWDKPVQGEWNSPASRYASRETFGHTGFTGTCLWVDPEFDLVYIFLSNRVFPDRSDKLIQTNIRSRIQDVIYEAMFNYCKTNGSSNF